MVTSLLVCIVYLWKICRLPRHVNRTHDQRALVWITVALVFFNDPTYPAAIYKPSLFTSVISQLWIALFFALMLRYWLRGVEKVKDLTHEGEALNFNGA
jgi:Wnt-binding factor required for Wnt secretion